MACVRNISLVSVECIGEDLSANNREYMVLEGSEGRKKISYKNEPKQFKNGTNLGNCIQLATVSCAKTLNVLKTAMAAVSKAHVM